MKRRICLVIEDSVHRGYKSFCRKNSYVMSGRIEQLMRADIKKRLLEIPEIKL